MQTYHTNGMRILCPCYHPILMFILMSVYDSNGQGCISSNMTILTHIVCQYQKHWEIQPLKNALMKNSQSLIDSWLSSRDIKSPGKRKQLPAKSMFIILVPHRKTDLLRENCGGPVPLCTSPFSNKLWHVLVFVIHL